MNITKMAKQWLVEHEHYEGEPCFEDDLASLVNLLNSVQGATGDGEYIGTNPEWDPKIGGDTLCYCGHTYRRHFDGCDPVGCKYCSSFGDTYGNRTCPTFKAMDRSVTAFTIGNTKSYDEALANDPDGAMKVGKGDDYEGGWIWETAAGAQTFIESEAFLKIDWGDGKPRSPENFSVYKVLLVNGWNDVSPIPGEDGIYHLLVDSRFSK